jgi:hypothetical protein
MISPPHTLPQELLDKIVDNVFDDHSTLLACSLAARPFLPATRYHLFSQSVVRLDRLDKLGELRTAHCSTIFHSIRHLNIAIDERISNDAAHGQVYTEFVEKFDFSGIQHLKVSYDTYEHHSDFWRRVGYCHSDTLGQNIFRSVLTRVTYLAIGDVTFDDPFAMQSFICSFTSLSTLELGGFKIKAWEINNDPLVPETTLPPSLTQFLMEDDLEDEHQPHLLNWLLAHDPVPLVRTVCFKYVQHESRPQVSRYLNAAGPSIKHLTLSVGHECGRACCL